MAETKEPRGCPHANIVFCPLYLAAHEASAISCADGQYDEGGCAVDRGMDYAAAVARLDPREVACLRWREEVEQSRQQRLRNMRAAGLH